MQNIALQLFIYIFIKCLTTVSHTNHLIISEFSFCIRKDINHEIMNILKKKHGYKTIKSIFHKPTEQTQVMERCILYRPGMDKTSVKLLVIDIDT
jgi:hypothetical protein